MADKLKANKKLVSTSLFVPMVEQEITYASREYSYKLASKLAGQLRAAILNQTYDWAPLSPAWLARKEALGWDLRILRATGDYVNSIVPRRHDDVTYVVAPSDKVTHSGKTLKQIGYYLEFGTLNANGTEKMPPRPHWRPVWMEFKADQDNIKSEIQKTMLKRLGKVFVRVYRRTS